MKPETILLPIDTAKCSLEAFARVNALANRPGATVILLHVVDLNIAALDNRVYDELGREAGWHLDMLARKYLRPDISTLIRVRFGNPATEIIMEAKARNVDLIILSTSTGSLPSHEASFKKRLRAALFPGLLRKLLRAAPGALWIVHGETSFNCREHWGRPEPAADPVPHRTGEPAATCLSPAFAAGDSPTSEPQRERLAA
jgi:nucleotide-binding universal stress UspA family protein